MILIAWAWFFFYCSTLAFRLPGSGFYIPFNDSPLLGECRVIVDVRIQTKYIGTRGII